MRARALLYSACFLLLLTLLAGCGGGGGGSTPELGATLSLSTDTMSVSLAASSRTVVGAALDEGGIVTVYNFLTKEVVATGTLDAQGKANVEVPAGLTVAIVITGTQGDPAKNYRLSLVIPTVPIDGGDYTADPVTSIAAEAIAQKYYGTQIISQSVLDVATAAAQAFVTANADADFSLTGDLITGTGTDFGEDAGLGADLDEIVNGVPDETNGVALAKIAVQQIKEAGTPLQAMVSEEPDDINTVIQDLTDKYQALGERLGALIVPAIGGQLIESGSPTDRLSVFDLENGQGYSVSDIDSEGRLVLVDSDANDIAGQITIVDDSLELVAKLSGSTWTVTQTSSEDTSMDYVVTVPESATTQEQPGVNPSFAGTISLEDSEFTTPITFNGTLSATGSEPNYTRAEFNGTLTGPNVNSTGDVVVTFLSELPEGVSPDHDTIDFPSAFSITGGNVSVTDEDTTIAITGDISATLVTIVKEGGWTDTVPTDVSISGTYSNSSSGLNFSGSIEGTWSNAPTSGATTANGSIRMQGELTRESHPTYSADLQFTKSGATISSTIDLRAGGNTLTGSGSVTLQDEGDPTGGSLTLTNQAGVVFSVTWDASGVPTGTVKVAGTTVANIGLSPDSDLHKSNTYRITYLTTPETYDDI
jgi:hypothetical protein